jgi:RNA polymerase subunit RPABC4/transcription elongation factor Spt4
MHPVSEVCYNSKAITANQGKTCVKDPTRSIQVIDATNWFELICIFGAEFDQIG